ncbi:hypothetical protein DPMN_166924 [Dreissena polymorpha]|uniref:Apple domain-containing protein n=1 Tax=Dreissena polymorpha TaxID=45954 RepID=A0A9D4EZT2_DREPO|nr:hypothetical protein DPMN_166924 [Dreissena polymorpha]
MCQHFRRNATNTGYNSTAIKTTYVTSSPTCAFACQTHHACVLYTFNMATGCRMYNDSDFRLVFEDPNIELWTLQHRRYC